MSLWILFPELILGRPFSYHNTGTFFVPAFLQSSSTVALGEVKCFYYLEHFTVECFIFNPNENTLYANKLLQSSSELRSWLA
jgi:hypothetical protein